MAGTAIRVSASSSTLLATLPSEMVLSVLSYLDSEDAVCCLAVSKSWRETVGALDTYWKKACTQLGLPNYLIEEHVLCKKCCTSPVALFLAARKQRLYISQSYGVFSRLERKKGEYSENVTMESMKTKRDANARLWNPPHRTQSMGHGYILEVVYGNGPPTPSCSITGCHTPHQNVSLALLGRIKGRTIQKICEFSPEIYANSAWIKIVPRHDCVVTMSNCIAPENDNQCMKYPIMPGQPQQHIGKSLSQPLLLPSVQHPLIHGLYFTRHDFPVETHSACSRCSLMVRATTVMPKIARMSSSAHSNDLVMSFTAFDSAGQLVHVHTEMLVGLCVSSTIHPFKVALLPRSTITSFSTNVSTKVSSPNGCSDGICSSHNLIWQAGENIGIHQVNTVNTPCSGFVFTPVKQFTFCKFSGARENTKNQDMIGEFVVSSDGELLGVLEETNERYHFPVYYNRAATLHVWSLASSGLTKVSEVEINQSHPTLYALGQIYSIVGFHSHDTVNVAVLSTHTGASLWKYVKPIKYTEDCTSGYCFVNMQPEIKFLAVIREEWLSNIHTISPPHMPFLVFTNFGEAIRGNLAVDGLSFHPSE